MERRVLWKRRRNISQQARTTSNLREHTVPDRAELLEDLLAAVRPFAQAAECQRPLVKLLTRKDQVAEIRAWLIAGTVSGAQISPQQWMRLADVASRSADGLLDPIPTNDS
jgi:hypothetical protein